MFLPSSGWNHTEDNRVNPLENPGMSWVAPFLVGDARAHLPLVGGLSYRANAKEGEKHFRRALELAPGSPIACIEMANGLVMIYGRRMVEEAGRLYAEAVQLVPRDAMEKLDVENAKAELA